MAIELSELALKAELADYSPVRGCMVIRPYGYAIWEEIQKDLDARIKECGHQNAYFPLFIPESFLKKEAEHVEGFSPELAVVTHAGGEKLEEPLVVRPTSETIIYHMFGKWIRSWRDLPYSINQWANVVRWEMRTRLFLRTTEFLWQEGHTAHATHQEAREEALRMLRVYESFMRETLALAPLVGEKTPSERFAGAETTFSLEVLLRDKKVLQAGTSHHLGKGFADAFEIKYQNKENEFVPVHLTSWGVSTRLVGAIIMGHQDEIGLILPPKVAPIQAIILPIYKQDSEKTAVIEACKEVLAEMKALGIRAQIDLDEQKTPGAKFNEWELKGVPLRIQIGPRDLTNRVVELVQRDNATKLRDIPRDSLKAKIPELLSEIQERLYQRNLNWRIANTFKTDKLDDLNEILDEKGGFVRIHWSGEAEHEAELKEKTKATIRVLAFDEPEEQGQCIASGKSSSRRVYVGRAY
ncbi:MAG: proline--tRNA ligase [Candidatus Caenarcaniphilales bacterium]|nr:proline--tRNA ligase [Candidatus Caenarcaniphilales bacterium]